jgi:hypothetical protein
MSSIKEAIYLLINLEKTLEDKCDLLTAIGITARHEETFKSCEDIRNEIVPDVEEVEKGRGKLVRSGDPGEEDSSSDGLQETDRALFDALSEL